MLKILLVVLLLAVVVYMVTWAIERRGVSRSPRRGGRGAVPQPPRQVAPDDDPEFLWNLERQRRREAKEHGAAAGDERPEDRQDEATGEDSPGTS